MATYYVRTTGSDATGDGSTGNPWATLHKAITTVTDNAEHTIKIGEGTYPEDSGSGYLAFGENRSEWLTIQPEVEGAEVVVTGASSATDNVLFPSGTMGYVEFKDITFRSRVNTNEYVVRFHGNAICRYVKFTDCIFDQLIGGDNDSKTAVYGGVNDTKSLRDVTFDGCTFQQTGTKGGSESVRPLSFTRTEAGATLDSITIDGCSFSSQGGGPILGAVTSLTFTDNVTISGNGPALTCGFDSGTTAQDCTGSVLRNKCKSSSSHGMLLGNGCNGLIARANWINGGDHGAVIKNSADVVFQGNFCTGGSGCYEAIYVKASSGTIITGNVGVGTRSGGWVLRVAEDATHSTTYAGVTVRGNLFVARNGAVLYYWGEASEETGETSVCNDNTLILLGSGSYGDVKGTADCATLAAVQAAWAGYDISTNDDTSADGDLGHYTALVGSGSGGVGLGL